MAFVSIDKVNPFLFFFVTSHLFHGIHGNQQQALTTKLTVINHEYRQSCPRKFSSLNDVDTYSMLKYDPRASLPSSFTFCVSVLVTSSDLHPILFTLLGNNGQPWFSAKFKQDGDFVGRRCYYSVHNQFAKIDTMWMFPNKGRVPKKCWFFMTFAIKRRPPLSPLHGTFSTHLFTPLFFCNWILYMIYMKRILHLVSVKNITFKSSYNWLKIDIHQQLRPLTANYLAMFKVISTTIYT